MFCYLPLVTYYADQLRFVHFTTFFHSTVKTNSSSNLYPTWSRHIVQCIVRRGNFERDAVQIVPWGRLPHLNIWTFKALIYLSLIYLYWSIFLFSFQRRFRFWQNILRFVGSGLAYDLLIRTLLLNISFKYSLFKYNF